MVIKSGTPRQYCGQRRLTLLVLPVLLMTTLSAPSFAKTWFVTPSGGAGYDENGE